MSECAIFIDEGCLKNVLRNNGEIRVNMRRLCNHLADGAHILKSYFYGCLPYVHATKPTQDELEYLRRKEAFFNILEESHNIYVRQGRLAYRGEHGDGRPRFVQKQIDVMLACDLVVLATKGLIDKAVIVAADADFVPALEIAKGEGVEIKLVHGQDSIPSDDLVELADSVEVLTWHLLNAMQLQQQYYPHRRRHG